MIGRLRGILSHKQPPFLLVDVQGVGYEVEAPMTTFYNLPETGEEISLFTHLIVRDDAHLLFGFSTHEERHMFRILIKVNGVGAKMALTILSSIEADDFAQCVRNGDTTSLIKLPGVGKKTAERLIVEMRDRLQNWGASGKTSTAKAANSNKQVDDAISALVTLGYKPQEASRFVYAVASDAMRSEEIIRAALKASVKR